MKHGRVPKTEMMVGKICDEDFEAAGEFAMGIHSSTSVHLAFKPSPVLM